MSAGYACKHEDGKLHFKGLVATVDGKEVRGVQQWEILTGCIF